MPARAEAGWHRRVPGLQPHLVAARAVEGDESPARARGRPGAEAVQRGRVSRAAVPLSRGPPGRGTVSGQVAPPWRMEGIAVQHVLCRHLQRAAARLGPTLWLAPAGVLHEIACCQLPTAN